MFKCLFFQLKTYEVRGKYRFHSFEFLKKSIIGSISEFDISIISSFQKPRNHKYYFFLGTKGQNLHLIIIMILVPM